ncbi:chromosome segregation ATPase [Streptomyces chartreusis]|uniref:chromosome segregation ATPase n=1 Tax=Streptomyces chartreusis TaxID=1969 RepID=UPI0036C632FA
MRIDQLTDLTALRKHVSAHRRDRSEIITDNTLIRVAVDLLMAHAHRLHGDTEEDLLNSVLPRRRAAAARQGASSGKVEVM